MAKATEEIVVEIDADSDLARVLAEAGKKPVRLVLDDQQYVVTRDPFNSVDHYDPEEFEEALRAAAGIMTPEEGERFKRTIYPWRDEEGRRIDPPHRYTDDRVNDADFWADYDPEAVREALRAAAGTFTPEEGERLKRDIYRRRAEGSKPPIIRDIPD
jgi:hypothetical protein